VSGSPSKGRPLDLPPMTPDVRDLPLFPLPLVLLPSEVVPLHIFEERYKEMIALCLDEHREFGIVWLSDAGLKEVGCTANVAEVLEQMEDGRMNILVRGGTPFRLLERQEHHAYPAGTVELLGDLHAPDPEETGGEARERYADLLETLTDERPEPAALDALSSYEMAATVDIDMDVKQGLLELRSEEARLRLLARLFKAGIKTLKRARDVADRASGNGKVDVR
jgi:Lon protease-like protein